MAYRRVRFLQFEQSEIRVSRNPPINKASLYLLSLYQNRFNMGQGVHISEKRRVEAGGRMTKTRRNAPGAHKSHVRGRVQEAGRERPPWTLPTSAVSVHGHTSHTRMCLCLLVQQCSTQLPREVAKRADQDIDWLKKRDFF